MEFTSNITPRERFSVAKLLGLGLIVLLVLAVEYRTLLFVAPWHEHSDYATNALQIERAGHFQEIYGNQSRFGFFHPGPAFFYIYAAGERVLFDWLHAVPSRYNAHLVAGLLLQAFFFTAALAVAADWIRRPLFLPLALLVGAIHFRMAGNAFVDIWPPRVLLMPFLCLLVAGASVAAGRARDLPLLVLAGCFLVHGHVAQPLFVVPVFLLAYGSLWRRTYRREEGWGRWWRNRRIPHLLSLACIVVFLVPLGLDLLDGAESNFARIVGFVRFHRGYAASLWRSSLYLAGFLCYLRKPEEFLPDHRPGRADFIGEHAGYYLAWAGVVAAGLILLFRVWRQRETASRPFVISLAGLIVLASLLCLRWGSAQIGGMFEYNGHFYYALLYAILLLACAAVSTWAWPAPRAVGLGLGLGAVLLAWREPEAPAIDYSTNEIPAAVQAALRADPAPDAPKYLRFGFSNWGEAASTALALHRGGKTFLVDGNWSGGFGRGAVFEPAPPDFDLRGVSVWRISYLGPSDRGRVFRDNLRIYFEPLPLDLTGAEIDGGADRNLELYSLFGFAYADGNATWTIRPHAGLIFQAAPVATDIEVSITAEPAQAPGKPAAQPMTLSVNGREVFSNTLRARATVAVRVPAAVWNLSSPVRLVMHFPEAIPPEQYGPVTEHRSLGWHIEKIRFEAR